MIATVADRFFELDGDRKKVQIIEQSEKINPAEKSLHLRSTNLVAGKAC